MEKTSEVAQRKVTTELSSESWDCISNLCWCLSCCTASASANSLGKTVAYVPSTVTEDCSHLPPHWKPLHHPGCAKSCPTPNRT